MTLDPAPAKKPSPQLYALGVLIVVAILLAGAFLAPPGDVRENAAPDKAAPPASPAARPREATAAKPPARETKEESAPDEVNDPKHVPGGGLASHELLGGHTLARHVGQSETQLRGRLAREPSISAASSFYDQKTAEEAVAAALAARANQIDRWLKSNDDRLEVPDYTCPEPIGISLRRGAAKAQEVRKVRVILQRRERAPLGYFVLTAYPQS